MTPESGDALYAVSFADEAIAEADAAYLRRSRFTGPKEAADWYEGIFKQAGVCKNGRAAIRFCRSVALKAKFGELFTGTDQARITLSTAFLIPPKAKRRVLCASSMCGTQRGRPAHHQATTTRINNDDGCGTPRERRIV